METILSMLPEFSGEAQLTLYTRYGDPREEVFVEKWIKPWNVAKAFPWFPAKRILVHKHFQDNLYAAFLSLEMKGLQKEIKSFDDGFHIRLVKGSESVLSTHSWGCAIDMNAAENPLASAGLWSDAFIQTMSANSIFCGQSWTGRKDPMHFGMLNG